MKKAPLVCSFCNHRCSKHESNYMKSDIFVAPLFCDKMFHKSLYLEISPVNVLFVPSSKNKEGMGTELRKGKKSVNLWSSIMK